MAAAWFQLMICSVCPLFLKTCLSFLWQDEPEKHLAHHVLDPCCQSHRAMPNMFTDSRGQYHCCPCGRVAQDNSVRLHKSVFSIWDTSPRKKKMPFASRWDQPTGTFSPIAGSLPLLSPAGSTQHCCRFRLSWCNCFPGPSSWSLLPRHFVGADLQIGVGAFLLLPESMSFQPSFPPPVWMSEECALFFATHHK